MASSINTKKQPIKPTKIRNSKHRSKRSKIVSKKKRRNLINNFRNTNAAASSDKQNKGPKPHANSDSTKIKSKICAAE